MKSTTCWHPKSPLRKGGVERARLKFKNYFPDPEVDMVFYLKKTWISVVNYTYPRPLQHPTQIQCNFRMFYYRVDSLRKKHSIYLWNIKL